MYFMVLDLRRLKEGIGSRVIVWLVRLGSGGAYGYGFLNAGMIGCTWTLLNCY